MENIFKLYSDLSNIKFLEEAVVTGLRGIKYEWKINEQVVEEYEVPSTRLTEVPVKQELEEDDFLDEVDKLIAKAQESIKQDYLTLNQNKQIKNVPIIQKQPVKEPVKKPAPISRQISSSNVKRKPPPVYANAPYKTGKPVVNSTSSRMSSQQTLKTRSVSSSNLSTGQSQQNSNINVLKPDDKSLKTSQPDLTRNQMVDKEIASRMSSLQLNQEKATTTIQRTVQKTYTVKLKDISMDVYLPKDVENLTNRHYHLVQKLVDAQTKLETKRTSKNAFLAKLNSYNSQECQQLSKKCEDMSSLYRLEVIFKKALELLSRRLTRIDVPVLDTKNSKIVSYLNSKILISYFESFYQKLDVVVREFKEEYIVDKKILAEHEFDVFGIFASKNESSAFTVYRSAKELERLALLRCNLMELNFQNVLFKILNDQFLRKIQNENESLAAKRNWSNSDKLDKLKQLHAILSLVTSKRIVLAI